MLKSPNLTCGIKDPRRALRKMVRYQNRMVWWKIIDS